MRANVFHGPGRLAVEDRPIPRAGYGEAVIKVRLTTICATDVHILKGEYAVPPGLVIGHEAVGLVYELGPGVHGYHIGQRVLVAATTPCGQCDSCLGGNLSQCGGALGGWRFGNTIDGAQAEFLRVPHAQANMAPVPDTLTDDDVLPLADIASAGFSAVESGGVRLGDIVAVFAQGPIGLCATLGAKLMGAADIYAIDPEPFRLRMAQRFGATELLRPSECDVIGRIAELTGGRGVDVAVEALGSQETFENALRVVRPGGTMSSVGVYSGHLRVPVEAIGCGLNDVRIVTTLCPGGKERMRRLMRLVDAHRVDLKPLWTHHFRLEDIGKAYELFSSRAVHVLKIAIHVE
jgi:threonine dehydrogenase-like Zn-dependent dehydrogenase